MDFSHFVMLKVFLSASVTSAIVYFVFYNIKSTKENVLPLQPHMGGIGRRGFLPVALGGFLLGSGLYLSGTCPGMVWVELGSYVQSSIYTCLGCFIGVFLYTQLNDYIEKWVVSSHPIPSTLMQALHCSYNTCALGFIFMLLLVIAVVEHYVPWKTELPWALSMASVSLTSPCWPPILTGVCVGLIQIPLLFMGKFMGTSMSYVTLLAQVYDKNETLRQAKHNYWQVLFVVGIFFGSLLSYFMTNSLYGSRYSTYTQLPMLPSLMGGILLLMGSKMMRGCTSAQGLSGMPLMCFPSMIATCFIFVGGIATCLLTKYFA